MSESTDVHEVDAVQGDDAQPVAAEPGEATASEAAELDEAADSEAGVPEAGSPETSSRPERAGSKHLVAEGDIAADYLEGLLDIADLDGDIDMDVEGDRAIVSIEGGDLKMLVGRGGEVLDALQELTRLAVLRETGERSRLMLDIDGFRARKKVELTELGTAAAKDAKESGERVALKPMTPFERKVVHDAVAAAGLTSESEGVEPMRHVVVLPG